MRAAPGVVSVAGVSRLPFDAYLLCATPRTGSTLLCGLLESSGVAGHPASYFRRESLDEYADHWKVSRPPDGQVDRTFIRAALTAGRTPNGAFGARVMGDTVPELMDALSALDPGPTSDLPKVADTFGRTRFVHLRRRDVVAQAVSWARSVQTHFWQPGEVAAPGGQRPRYDRDLITQLVARVEGLEAGWGTWFETQGLVPHEVTYEELSADPTGTAHAVLDFLGVDLPEGVDLTTGHRRQADALNVEWITRFRSGS